MISTKLGLLALAVAALAFGIVPDVQYPEGYRQWTHVKSMVIQESHPLYESFGGIHHIYANDPALTVLKGERSFPFPDGSVLAFDLLEAKSEGGAVTEGSRKFVGVMTKDGSRYGDTGGWGFAAFGGDSRSALDVDAAGCFDCHQSAQRTDFVFTKWRP